MVGRGERQRLPQASAVSAAGVEWWRRLGEGAHRDPRHPLLITAQQSQEPGSTGDRDMETSIQLCETTDHALHSLNTYIWIGHTRVFVLKVPNIDVRIHALDSLCNCFHLD